MSDQPPAPSTAGKPPRAEKMIVAGLIEGIIYLTKSDEEFVDTYVKGRKGWF